MKKLTFILAAALTALAAYGALPQPDLVAQIHFAGGDRIAADKSYSAFTNEFSSPEALALRKQTADKLAPWLAGWLQAKQGMAVPEGAAKLRPLFDDLQTAEWFLEARAAAGGKPDVAIAIKLDAPRMQAWQTALTPYFPAATYKQSAGWFIFDSGTGTIKTGDLLTQKISTPQAGWLHVDVSWPRLAQWYPELKGLGLPETVFTVAGPDGNLHINGTFFFPENLSLKLDPWQIPTNVIRQPFVSFTAARGFAGWLNGQDWAQSIKLTPPANQFFMWAMYGSPFQVFAAVPVANSIAALAQVTAGLQPVVAKRNTTDGFYAPAGLEVTNRETKLIGEPIIQPYVSAVNSSAGNFLLAGGFPNPGKNKPLPPELLQRLATPNLLFYHWEITTERLPLLFNVSQLTLMLTRHKELNGDSAAFKWMSKFGSKLGYTGTEITQSAPDQMTFSRIAPGGLTSLEFLSLANWLEAGDFPHCSLALPPISERVKQRRALHPPQ